MFRFALALAVVLPSISFADADANAAKRSEFEQYALTHAGDAERGKALFASEKVTKCLVCHKAGKAGGDVGPDLTNIGNKFDRPHLVESLLYPSKQIGYGYNTTTIITDDGKTYAGIVKERTEESLVVIGADGQRQTVAVVSIEEEVPSKVSLMPDGLVDGLTAEAFVDLIAYMETLSTVKKSRFGSGTKGPIDVPDGYRVEVVATGIDAAVALEVLDDGRVLVCEQTGALRVVENDVMLDEPMITLPVATYWERGLIGVTVDPAFPEEPWLYVNRVVEEPFVHHVVSRFRVDGNVADPASEEVLIEGDDQGLIKANYPAGHQGGGIHFGPDGCLYIAVGEQTAGKPSQQMDILLGKILRINRDGSIPSDNPFVAETSGKYQSIWAIGCRNPFTFAIRESDGHMLINDVGGKFEEINVGKAGGNFGWPKKDHGPLKDESEFEGPIHWYPASSINGGDFAPGDAVGEWAGRYFFADFIHGWLHTIDPEAGGKATEFASGLRRPVDLRFSRDGDLYVLLRNSWVIDNKFTHDAGSLIKISRDERVIATPVELDSDAETAGGLPAFRVRTPNATYELEKTGAGLSRMIDRDGNDWIGFDPAKGTGAAGEYRGFPNAVFQEAGSYFHARNAGTDVAVCEVVVESPEHVAITAASESGHWAGQYDFYPDHATFTMTKMPPENGYWVLYEGTPGGQYDDTDWWMTSGSPSKSSMTLNHEGDLPAPEWIAFGDVKTPRSLVLYHHEDDSSPDRFYQMERKMTVFGFGRHEMEKHLRSVPQRFSIGLVESDDYQVIRETVAGWDAD